MTNLITGGSGYFGSILVNKLVGEGSSCRVLDLIDNSERPDEVDLHLCDIREYKSVLNACDGVEVVYHNVAQVPIVKDKKLVRSVNIVGIENILKASLECGVRKVVYTSSSAIFGNPEILPVTECTNPNPAETYGWAKYRGELFCNQFIDRGLDVSIIRPRTILGHGRLGIFQILFDWIRKGHNIPVLGKGDNLYQFVHADDLARACILASKLPGPSLFNCGAEQFCTMRQTLEHLCNYADTGSRVISVPFFAGSVAMKLADNFKMSPLGAYHALMYGRSMYFDLFKIKKELKWIPKYSNYEMIVESYEKYVNAPEGKEGNLVPRSQHLSGVKPGILSLLKWVL